MKFVPALSALIVSTLLLFLCQSAEAQPGRDLEFKGDHPQYHYTDSMALGMVDMLGSGGLIQSVFDSVPPEDRVYIRFDTLQGFVLNGHRFSVYEFPSVLRYALTNPARKPYLPQEPSKATLMLLIDYPLFDYQYIPSYKTQIGPDYLTSTITNVLYDVWNEDSRYTEDKVFGLLDEEAQMKVAHRNPHRIQWLNFSDEYFVNPTEGIKPPIDMDEDLNVLTRNIIEVEVGLGTSLQLSGEDIRLEDLYSKLLKRMKNEEQRPDWPQNLSGTFIQVSSKRETNYEFYLEVYNTIKAVYRQLWDEAAQNDFQRGYDELSQEQQKTIRKQIPLQVSESEPGSFDN